MRSSVTFAIVALAALCLPTVAQKPAQPECIAAL